MIRRTLLATALLWVAFVPTATAQDFPEFTNYVVDEAGVIEDGLEQQINAELEGFEDRTKTQIAVAVVDTIGDTPLENYTIDLAREWKIGVGGNDNGLLLFLAIRDRLSRIEVGDELEGDVTDVESGRILRGQMRTQLQEGNYGDAVLIATRQLRSLLGDTTVDVPVPEEGEPLRRSPNVGSWLWIVPFLVFGPLSAIGRRGARRRGWVTPIFWGGGFGGLGGGSGGSSGGFGGGGGGGGFSGGGASGDW